mmetsp:Transcript_84365/g.145866  ORF Transcript_84365/g.145866 Transcript_84365/m.145866 type:complete len:83 (+) Transcript_84365:652-900(+)
MLVLHGWTLAVTTMAMLAFRASATGQVGLAWIRLLWASTQALVAQMFARWFSQMAALAAARVFSPYLFSGMQLEPSARAAIG